MKLKKISSVPLSALRGRNGANGKDGRDGAPGLNGRDGADGRDGKDGKDGITTTIIKEVALDLSDIKAEVADVAGRVEKLEKKSVSSTNNNGYFPGGRHSPDLVYATADVSVGTNDAVVICTVSCTVKLPPKPSQEQRVTVKQGAAAVEVTIDGNGKYIDGDTTASIAATGDPAVFTGLQLVYARNKWYLI